MNELSSTNPDVHQIFMNGHHVIGVSFWTGVSTDVAIEQKLMSSVKKTGVLTVRLGMTELQRAK